jgi:recombinational DNA repair protein RecR
MKPNSPPSLFKLQTKMSPDTRENITSYKGKYHKLQTKMSPDTRENITSYKGKYHKLQAKMSPVTRENITSYKGKYHNLQGKIFMKILHKFPLKLMIFPPITDDISLITGDIFTCNL